MTILSVTANNFVDESATFTALNASTGAVPMPSVGEWGLIVLAITLASIIGWKVRSPSKRDILSV
ncbi:MAG: hypothetical protein LR120_13540 [Dehalococcoidia bacterium]|nr:hypothetical protein [Dehalococcoidia bacterium]